MLLVGFAGVAFTAVPVGATVGYDGDATVVGYDAADRKIYYTVTDGSGVDWSLYYLDLDDESPRQPHQVRSWWKDAAAQDELSTDAYLLARLEKLRARLEPLEPVNDPIETSARVRPDGEVPSPTAPEVDVARYAIELEVRVGAVRGELEATGYCRPSVEVAEALAVPGEDVAVVVVSYVGNPMESCYRVGEVVLLEPTHTQ